MFCSKCNNTIKVGQEVCLSCGHILHYESEASKLCIHCNRNIPIEYKKCPYCKKKQKSKKRLIMTLILLVIVVVVNYNSLCTIVSRYSIANDQNYKEKCTSITYEEMIRKNKFYDESLLVLEGEITSVKNINSLFKIIKVEIVLEENKNYKADVIYTNYSSRGFIIGDKIIVYGKYKSLNGNTPQINSKIIEIKNSE